MNYGLFTSILDTVMQIKLSPVVSAKGLKAEHSLALENVSDRPYGNFIKCY